VLVIVEIALLEGRIKGVARGGEGNEKLESVHEMAGWRERDDVDITRRFDTWIISRSDWMTRLSTSSPQQQPKGSKTVSAEMPRT
jgi:hypothetical protein